ncbi:MAG: aminotransferase DegT [Chloroflexi bacterium HGW-Chloroflexi-1]|nr:MAG: aminotransferase DegT [Chloroflexi bacterium HGW-Chloroflexi-1]
MTSALAIAGGPKVREKPFPAWPIYGTEEEEALLEVVRSGKWGRLAGDRVRTFEEAFAAYQDARHGIAVTNGTVALRLALLAAGVEEGDEVIVPPYTFLATASAVVEVNGTPVFVDIEPDTCNIDPAKIEAALTPRTRAIIPVHFAGQAADLERITAIARRHNLVVIEDAAHAHGATYRGRKVGAIGDMGCFSFQSSKNLTAGEGGVILTNAEHYERLCRSLHNCGRLPEGIWYEHHLIGGNYRMTEFQGAVLLAQLARLEEQTRTRDANGRYLNARLAEVPGIRSLARGRDVTRHSYHLYIVRYDPAAFSGAPRARFLAALSAEGIPCSGGYPVGLYAQPLFANRNFGPFGGARRARPDLRYDRADFPVCEQTCAEACWLSQSLLLGTREDMDDIVRAVWKVYEQREDLKT